MVGSEAGICLSSSDPILLKGSTMAKVKRTTVTTTTLEVDGKKAGAYSLTLEQVQRLIAGETVVLKASNSPPDIFDSIRLCNDAKEMLDKDPQI